MKRCCIKVHGPTKKTTGSSVQMCITLILATAGIYIESVPVPLPKDMSVSTSPAYPTPRIYFHLIRLLNELTSQTRLSSSPRSYAREIFTGNKCQKAKKGEK